MGTRRSLARARKLAGSHHPAAGRSTGRHGAHTRIHLCIVAAVVAAAAVVPAAAAAATLSSRLTSVLAAHGFGGAVTGVRVVDLSSATALYDRHYATQLLPASNEKLVTSSTALAKWGANYRFKTEMLTTGTLAADGTYTGAIFIKGFGDPTLSTASYQSHVLHFTTARLEHFVTALQNAGVKRIVGRIAGDDTWFDKARTVGSWNAGESDDCAPLSALCLNGDLAANGSRLKDPARTVAAQLTALLRKHGIPVSGAPTVYPAPAKALVSYTEKSAPLSRILAAMNKPSDNFYAEELTKGLGAAFGGGGTTARGNKVESAFLVSQGIAAGHFRLYDGSGLSYKDRLTTLDLTVLLQAMSRRADWTIFWRSLAVAGVDGTLSDRMKGTAAYRNVHAKTGTLEVASNLSGYVLSANGHWLCFSILMNHYPWIDVAAAHVAQDAIAVDLAKAKPGGKIVWAPNPVPSAAAGVAAPGATANTTE